MTAESRRLPNSPLPVIRGPSATTSSPVSASRSAHFPGGHSGYTDWPEEFGRRLAEVLGAR